MRILVACEMPDAALEELRGLGGEVAYKPTLTAEQLPANLGGVMALIVGRTTVSAEAILAATTLQLIVRAGTDVSNIAVDEASAQGVFVFHTPHRDAVAIAEMLLTLALALDRSLLEAAGAARSASKPPELPPARGLAGRALGILGFGPAGRELATRARSFAMDVLAWSPVLTPNQPQERRVTFCAHPRDLARRSDIVCTDLTDEQADAPLADEELVAALRDGTHVIHVGASTAIHEQALADAVRTRRLRLAMDLSASESITDGRARSRLAELPGVLVTHRLARQTLQARAAIAAEVVRIVREFLVSGSVRTCVNLLERSPATWQLVMRLRDAVGVMASIMDAIRADGINAEEITSRVFTGARAAWCTIALDERPSTEALDAIRKIPGVLHLELRAVV